MLNFSLLRMRYAALLSTQDILRSLFLFCFLLVCNRCFSADFGCIIIQLSRMSRTFSVMVNLSTFRPSTVATHVSDIVHHHHHTSSSSDRVDSRGPLRQPRVATTTSLGPFSTNAEGCTVADLLDPWMARASWPSPPTRTKAGAGSCCCHLYSVRRWWTANRDWQQSWQFQKQQRGDFFFSAIYWLIDYGAPGGPKTSILHRFGTSCPYNSVTVNVLHCDEHVTGFLIDWLVGL